MDKSLLQKGTGKCCYCDMFTIVILEIINRDSDITTIAQAPYGANCDIELWEHKDEELKFWRNCFYHIDML